MNSVWTDNYQRPLLTVCLYARGAEGWEKLQQCPLITNLPLCVKFGTKLMGIRILIMFFRKYFLVNLPAKSMFIDLAIFDNAVSTIGFTVTFPLMPNTFSK